MPRNRDGFLKPDALMAGVPDQYAVDREGIRHAIWLVHASQEGGYVVRHATRPIDQTQWSTSTTQYGADLGGARQKFRRIVRSLGGRA